MKKLLVFLAMLVAAPAFAATFTQLYPPTPAPIHANAGWPKCAPIGFNADSSVVGACVYEYGSCGRFCHPATSTYAIHWAADGSSATVVALCGSTTAAITGRVVTTYYPPYTVDTCHVKLNPTNTVIEIDGSWYYYISASLTGSELVSTNAWAYLVTP